jgi:hypothetical protein
VIAVLLYVAGFVLIGVSFPVDGLLGAALALVGMLLIWAGWFRVARRNRGGAR